MEILSFLVRVLFGGIMLSTAIYLYLSIKKTIDGSIYPWMFYVFGFSFVAFVIHCIMFKW